MWPTDAGTGRAFRDRPLGRAAILVAVLVVALLVARSCASRNTEITKEEAIVIAKGEIDFEPDAVQVRFFPRGVQSRPFWGVSLYTGTRQQPTECRIVQIDANTGRVAESNDC
jgi:hypothetical protein